MSGAFADHANRPLPPNWPVTVQRGDATIVAVPRLVPDRPVRRLVQLYAGLVLFGLSMAMMIRAGLGVDPWDVLHQGIANRTGLSFGTVVIGLGLVVLLAWIPLRQLPGVGTISNVIIVGLVVDAGLDVMTRPSSLGLRIAELVAAVVLQGVAGGSYIGAGLGPGPRDGLMTGLVRSSGRSVRLVRTTIEATVLVSGWLLGGTVGIGTVLYAATIGPLVHVFLPLLTIAPAHLTGGAPIVPEPLCPEPATAAAD